MTTAYVTQSAPVPVLDIDLIAANSYGRQVIPRGRLERRIVANLIEHLIQYGFHVHSVFDGDEEIRVNGTKAAMELIFNLDEASLRFYQGGRANWHGVLLVLGNGVDIVSDWNYFADDHDGFNKAMDAFDAELFA